MLGPRNVPPYAFHQILGVNEESTHEEIVKSYRKLARRYHPDKNPGNTDAEETFKAVGAAYSVLGDENERKIYEAECRRWNMNGGPRQYQTEQQEVSVHPATRAVLQTLPRMVFSRFIEGLAVGSISKGVAFFGLALYDFMTYPFLVSLGIFPSLILTPVLAFSLSMLVAPLFCNNWADFTSYLHGYLWDALMPASATFSVQALFGALCGIAVHYDETSALTVKEMKSIEDCAKQIVYSLSQATSRSTKYIMNQTQRGIAAGNEVIMNCFRKLLDGVMGSYNYLLPNARSYPAKPMVIENIEDGWELVPYDNCENSNETDDDEDDWVLVTQ